VGTRQPKSKKCLELIDLGVNVSDDNTTATERVRVLVIACLPSQMMEVARSVSGTIRKSTLILSVVPGFSASKIAKMFRLEDTDMVLRIGCQVPVSVISNALGEYPDNTTLSHFAGSTMLSTSNDVNRLHNAFVKVSNTVLKPTPLTDEKGNAIISNSFSRSGVMCQALYGNHIDPGKDVSGGIGQSRDDARKVSIISRFPSILMNRTGIDNMNDSTIIYGSTTDSSRTNSFNNNSSSSSGMIVKNKQYFYFTFVNTFVLLRVYN